MLHFSPPDMQAIVPKSTRLQYHDCVFKLPQVLLSKRVSVLLRWGLFLYLGLVLCPIQYWAPDHRDVDNTWLFALNYAAAHHLVMGRDIAWTYGPLSYLLFPFDIGNNLAKGLAFQAGFWALLVLILWDVFFRGGFPLRNLAGFSVFVGLSTLDLHQLRFPETLLLCPSLILLVHSRLRGGIIRYVAALAIMGLMPLSGPVVSPGRATLRLEP